MPIAPRSKCVLILGRRPRNSLSLWCRSLGVATFELQEPFVTSSVKSSGGSTRLRLSAQASAMADFDQPLMVQAVLESEEDRPRPRGKRPREGEEGESSAGKPPLRWCARTRSFI